MSRVVYYTATTLDGFIADTDDSLDWLMRQDSDPAGPLGYDAFITGVGALVMGSTTYQWLLDQLRAATDQPDQPDAGWPYDLPAWVFTTRDLPRPDGTADVRLVSGGVADIYADLAAASGGKNIWVVGGGDLAGQFADAGLLGEVITYTAPVTLGEGRPLLPRRLELELLQTRRNRAFVASRYRVVGSLVEGQVRRGSV